MAGGKIMKSRPVTMLRSAINMISRSRQDK
jgi:hypothetical protein